MPRARNIKPDFFTNDNLVSCNFAARLLFIGLWTMADREGRLEDRPLKIKMTLFPADNVDVNDLLSQLEQRDFILRYKVEENEYIQILNFAKHQNPHPREKASNIPSPEKALPKREKALPSNADILNPDILNPDNTMSADADDEPARPKQSKETRFEEFWKAYPRHENKKKARQSWASKNLDRHADAIIADVMKRRRWHEPWRRNIIPHATTYLNGERWEDEITPPPDAQPGTDDVAAAELAKLEGRHASAH